MAIVGRMSKMVMDRQSRHTEADASYSVIVDETGRRLLQIDTYGSSDRQILGKKSQSIRFSPEALEQLREILETEV
ncbi:MAG: methionyl-tRNA formyltransferase [Coriobacteriia bacterium]|nr:methionyl-tRNA formyltransferase [Coriobacteriia bacterium]